MPTRESMHWIFCCLASGHHCLFPPGAQSSPTHRSVGYVCVVPLGMLSLALCVNRNLSFGVWKVTLLPHTLMARQIGRLYQSSDPISSTASSFDCISSTSESSAVDFRHVLRQRTQTLPIVASNLMNHSSSWDSQWCSIRNSTTEFDECRVHCVHYEVVKRAFTAFL